MAKKRIGNPEGLAIPAGLFIGMGVGFLTNNFVGWMYIGLGAGFLTMLIYLLIRKKGKNEK